MLPAVLILAACGGSRSAKAPAQIVRGPGFRFSAPAGWTVEHRQRLTMASHGSELVQVVTFPLGRVYSPALFDAVETELAARMQQVAKESGGSVSPADDVTAAGIKSHAYDVKVGDHVDRYTFVLRGKREYLLLCRRKSSSHDDFCVQLVTSFGLA